MYIYVERYSDKQTLLSKSTNRFDQLNSSADSTVPVQKTYLLYKLRDETSSINLPQCSIREKLSHIYRFLMRTLGDHQTSHWRVEEVSAFLLPAITYIEK